MKTVVLDKIQVGSNVFFSGYDDFNPHDSDFICKLDRPLFKDKIYTLKKGEVDSFLIYWKDKEDLVKQVKEPLQAGKFLVPEFVKQIGFTIDDLKGLQRWFDMMDERHSYEKMIFNYYIMNNGFFLTIEQRNAAYEEYKSKRYL